MPATMYPEDTMNQKGVCSHEAYILMGETKTVEKKKEQRTNQNIIDCDNGYKVKEYYSRD